MTIGLDFDNTIINTDEVSLKYIIEYKKKHNIPLEEHLSEDEHIECFYNHYEEITMNAKVKDGFMDAYKYFKENNYKLYLITARGELIESHEGVVQKFLEKNGIVLDGMHFNAYEKVRECKLENVDIMIDDSTFVIEAMVKNNINVIRFGHESDISAYALNWHEALEKIKGGLNG